MKKMILMASAATLMLTSACSDDKKSAAPKTKLPDRENVKYAGAVMFEMGTVPDRIKMFSDDGRQATGQIYFCVDKDREVVQKGTLTIQFSDFGYVGERGSAYHAITKKRHSVIKDSVEVEYDMNGWIQDSVIGGYEGKFNFETKVISTSWRLLNDDGSIGELISNDDYNFPTSHSMVPGPVAKDFEVKLSPNNIAAFGAKSHKFQDQSYYLSNQLMYTIVNEEHGVNLVDICEEQDEDIVIVKE